MIERNYYLTSFIAFPSSIQSHIIDDSHNIHSVVLIIDSCVLDYHSAIRFIDCSVHA